VIVSVHLTFQTVQYRYVIKCPNGAHVRLEDGVRYVIVPSPFEEDDFGEVLWLNEGLLILTARAGAWGFHMVSETALTEETTCQLRGQEPQELGWHGSETTSTEGTTCQPSPLLPVTTEAA
jgi:hypothetical protein